MLNCRLSTSAFRLVMILIIIDPSIRSSVEFWLAFYMSLYMRSAGKPKTGRIPTLSINVLTLRYAMCHHAWRSTQHITSMNSDRIIKIHKINPSERTHKKKLLKFITYSYLNWTINNWIHHTIRCEVEGKTLNSQAA